MRIFLLLIIATYSSIIYPQKIPKLPNTISAEQKLYELSVVWKEVAYNFDNFQDDTQAKLDSLYRAYIPLVMNTTNDLEYYKVIQRFLAHCNNDHTGLRDWDNPLLDDLIARPYLRTIFRDDRILVSNFADYLADKLNIGDEIIEINRIPAMEYMQTHYVPYFSSSKENKIHYAMFAKGLAHHEPLNTPIELKLRDVNTKKEKTVTILADRKLDESADRWVLHDFRNETTNFFFRDTISKTSYLRLRNSSQATTDFFRSYIAEISQSEVLVLDLSEHIGGAGRFDDVIWNYLINKDMVRGAYYATRSHYPLFKSFGGDYCTGASEVSQEVNNAYCPYYTGSAFLPLQEWGQVVRTDGMPKFQGTLYVIIGRNCSSAGEQLALMLSQDEKIRFFGEKTAGATGRPYIFKLPSGLEIWVETGKFYNFQQECISTGIIPHYCIDFYDCYQTDNPQQLLDCLLKKIENALR